MSGKKYIVLALLGVLAFMPFIPYINYVTNVNRMTRCIFCEIVNGQIPQTKLEYQGKDFVIFKDIKPASTHHYLAVSKRHIDSVKTLTIEDTGLLLDMEAGLREFFTNQSIDTNDSLFGFHLPPFISVKHLHMHGIAPRSAMGFTSRLVFRPGSAWFKTPDEIRSKLQEKAKVESSSTSS